jgi:hypothetical protein
MNIYKAYRPPGIGYFYVGYAFLAKGAITYTDGYSYMLNYVKMNMYSCLYLTKYTCINNSI